MAEPHDLHLSIESQALLSARDRAGLEGVRYLDFEIGHGFLFRPAMESGYHSRVRLGWTYTTEKTPMDPLPAACSVLQAELDDGVAVVTRDRSDVMNTLSLALRRALMRVFHEIAPDEVIRVVILTGRGRAFCAGLYLAELAGEADGAANDPVVALDETDMISALRACPVPVIGAINGFAISGGFELALACDFLIASGETLRLEASASREFSRSVLPADIAARRQGIRGARAGPSALIAATQAQGPRVPS